MPSLRQRQKEDRRKRIVNAAKKLFALEGFEKTTIEAIAAEAEMSSVTVHNYYGTKSGILLALVVESDRDMVDRLKKELSGQCETLTDLVTRFAHIMREHATSYMDKSIWRQAVGASIMYAGSPFGDEYLALDQSLSQTLADQVEALQRNEKIPQHLDAQILGHALFQLQNARFNQFISHDDVSSQEIDEGLRKDLKALFNALK